MQGGEKIWVVCTGVIDGLYNCTWASQIVHLERGIGLQLSDEHGRDDICISAQLLAQVIQTVLLLTFFIV